ncbi:MAG: flagellar hook-associated protein FlgK [Pseudomonadales bacterium]
MSNSSLINIGLSGVRAHQQALATTGQNITNASTPGYSRQRVNLEAQVTTGAGTGMQGVLVQGVERIVDEATLGQLRLDTSSSARLDALSEQLAQVDLLLADEATSLNRGFDAFFAALQSAASSPTSLPGRQLVLSEAEGLVMRFQSLDGRLREQRAAVNRQAQGEIDAVNRLATSIGELNARLTGLEAQDGNTNALLDQRDELLRQLAERVDVRTVAEGKLGMNVFVGKGQALVVGATVRTLELSASGAVTVSGEAGGAGLAVDVRGGSLGGLLGFREQTLDPVINDLGRLALAFAGTVNEMHGEGLDLRGAYGGNLFADLNAASAVDNRVVAANQMANASTVTLGVRIEEPTALMASEYRVRFLDVGGTFEVRRESDGTVVANGSIGAARPQAVSFDGLSLEIGEGEIRAGADFRVTAAALGVNDLGVALRDPRDLALAGPVAFLTGDANQGSGQIALSTVDDVGTPLFSGTGELLPPLLVRFTADNRYEVLDATDRLNPRPLNPPMWGLPFVPGGVQALLPDADQQLIVADGQDANALPDAVATSLDLGAVANAVGSETLRLSRIDPQSGAATALGSVAIQPGMSARAVAAALEQLDGVSAAARTELTISNLRDNGIGEPLTVAVNGERLVLAPGSSLDDLADAISASATLRDAGIRARSDGTTLTLTAERGDDLSLHVAGDVTDGITVSDSRGASLDLDGAGPGDVFATVSVAGSVRLLLESGLRLESDSAVPGGGLFSAAPVAQPAGLGFQAGISGRPRAGDTFEIRFNDAGNLDNYNALALAELQVRAMLGDPPISFSEAYSGIVEKVGIRTSQTRTDAQAAEALLQQSVARRESVSGVNLDEEAANLIKFEQGYNASARVVSVAKEIFDVLLGAVA